MTIGEIIKKYNIKYDKNNYHWYNRNWQRKKPHDLELIYTEREVVIQGYLTINRPLINGIGMLFDRNGKKKK